jgi:pyruvate dehydrogenase E2 component (dihydrolipoamide acetyltransferase)/2-oxoisovalerate dehydrogenase E2 component (dihydrolipoyl transacylase)
MEFKLPEIGEGVYEAELTRWLVQPGQAVKRGQDLFEVMTDKATMTVPAPFAGTILTLDGTPGKLLKVGHPVLTYRAAEDAAAPVAAATTAEKPVPVRSATEVPVNGVTPARNAPRNDRLPVKAAPSVRLKARKLGVNLATVTGSGPDGRILLEDITRQVPARVPATPVKDEPGKTPNPETLPDLGQPGTRMKIVGMRRMIAEQMVRSKKTIPDYTYVEEVDITDLVRLREQVRQIYYKAGVKLTYLPFWVKAVTAALKEVPLVNSTLDEENNEIVLHDRYNIGVAVSTPGGLIVPVLRDADQMDVGTIARELERLSNEGRAGTIKRDDLRGGTFTITSVGNLGGLITTPVINHPEVGILGMGKMVRRPMYDTNGNIRPADLIYFCYSFDHRVIDGAVCAQFSNAVLKQLANPVAMLLPARL